MKKQKIKLVELYLKNYKPFYESMGLREFHINKRSSPYSLTLIIGANGSGKTYLLTELSPELLEHTTGRISNRFIDGEDGEKRLHFAVDGNTEYICTILYDKAHKSSCFFKRINLDTGEEEELNPNGNVTSYQELCQTYLNYNKIYKNIGYITEDVKNVVTMPSSERQQLFSTWLPDMSQFLTASKIIQKKVNSTKREIESLVADITKISISTYRENLANLKTNLKTIDEQLLFYRDHISKINLLLTSSFSRYNKELLKEHIANFKSECIKHEKSVKGNEDTFKKYGVYLKYGKDKLHEDISQIKIKKAACESDLNGVNEKISMLQNTIDRLRTVQPDAPDETQGEQHDILSIDKTITNIKESLYNIETAYNESLRSHPHLKSVEYSDELKDAVKHIIALLLSMYQVGNNIIQSCDGFTLQDLFMDNSAVLENFRVACGSLEEQNEILKSEIEGLKQAKAELSKISVDSSIFSYIPSGCSEKNCSLINRLLSHMDNSKLLENYDNEINSKQITIEENKNKLSSINLKTAMIDNIIKDTLYINNTLFENKEKVVMLPPYIVDKINNPKIYEFIPSINIIVKELQQVDEYLSVLEKRKASTESIQNLLNIYRILKYNDSRNNELTECLEQEKKLYTERDNIGKDIEAMAEEISKLENLDSSIADILNEKKNIDDNRVYLERERGKLLNENTALYNKRVLECALSCFKIKEADLVKNESLAKTEIEKCTAVIANRDALEQRKGAMENKLRLYELLYSVWNPRTGYPSMLIKEFLDEVAYVTNYSLDNIWGGLIRIKEFNITENDFKIPILRGNTVLSDIIECSKAEKNTLSLAISLAIIQVSTSYNIIRIDEADGGFDNSRRQSFMNMISEQLLQAGCEDCYIITHNNLFDTIPCNLILLKGYEELTTAISIDNKNIIYRYN